MCKICSKIFASSQALQKNYVEHKPIPKIGKKYSLNIELSESSIEVICDNCGRVMQNSQALNEHIATHHKLYPTTPKPPNYYQCDLCTGKYDSWNALNDHIKDVHEQSKSPEQKKKKNDVEEEALKRMKSLSVSEEQANFYKALSDIQDEKVLEKRAENEKN